MTQITLNLTAFIVATLGALTMSTPTFAQDSEERQPAVVFQSGYNYNWLVNQDKIEHFEEFADQAFYGAFVANDDGDSYWYSGFHNLETARTASLAWCALEKSDGSSKCELIAYLVPKIVDEDFVSGLSNTAIDEYNEFLTYDTSRAFAVSANGAYAYAWEHLSQADADEAALATCNESAEEKDEWEIGESYRCILFSEGNDTPVADAKPKPRIKK